jgi:ribosomal protein S18 acetylase RimI-like enzyme
MALSIKVLRAGDESVLDSVADGVFDGPVDGALRSEFLRDPRHHLAVAIDNGVVVAFASGVHYVHPDKPPELWINEVGVSPAHQRRGIARAVLAALMSAGRELGCGQAWVLTDHENAAARALYRSAGGTETSHIMVSIPLPPPPFDEPAQVADSARPTEARR